MGVEENQKKSWQERSCLYKMAVLGSVATGIYTALSICWIYGLILPYKDSTYSYEELRNFWLAICFGCIPLLTPGVLIGLGFAIWEEYLGH